MKRSSSAPCLADEELAANQRKRVKGCSDETEGPNTREYLQLALARVLELQRSLNDDTYFNDDTSDLGDSDNEDDLMRHVLTKVFRDLPGSSRSKVTQIIERATRSRHTAEMEKIRGKSIQLSGYDTCRQVAVDFMKRAAKAERPQQQQQQQQPLRDQTVSIARRRSIDDFVAIGGAARRSNIGNSSYELRMRMLTSLDLHLATKQRDYTARLMRH